MHRLQKALNSSSLAEHNGGDSIQNLPGGRQHPTESERCFSHEQILFSTEAYARDQSVVQESVI